MNCDIEAMLELFEDREAYLRKLKKETYESNTEAFEGKYGTYMDNLIESVDKSDDRTATADSLALELASAVKDKYSKRGRIKSTLLMDLNFMMIYYFFPYLLKIAGEHADTASLIAETVKKRWNEILGCNISYAPYEEIAAGFKKKLFGYF